MQKEYQINKLLEKYYEGDTSQKEEKKLKALLEDENCPPGFEYERMIFAGLTGIKAEDHTKQAEIFHPSENTGSNGQNYPYRFFAAASVTILAMFFSGVILLNQHTSEPGQELAVRNAQVLNEHEAKEETMKALQKVATAMEDGEKELREISRMGFPGIQEESDNQNEMY